MTVNERLKFLVEHLEKDNQRQFALKAGVTPTVIGSFMPPKKEGDRVSKPSYEVLSKIISAYPNINAEWLLTGEGEPFKKAEGQTPANSGTINKNTASGNTVSVGTVSANPGELEHLRTRIKDLEQKIELQERIIQLLTPK